MVCALEQVPKDGHTQVRTNAFPPQEQFHLMSHRNLYLNNVLANYCFQGICSLAISACHLNCLIFISLHQVQTFKIP